MVARIVVEFHFVELISDFCDVSECVCVCDREREGPWTMVEVST